MGVNGVSRPHVVWLSWFGHRRTESLCQEWGIPLEIIPDGRLRGVARRVLQIWRTFLRLFRAREAIVFVQNPSLGLTCVACAVRMVRRNFKLVVDAHNEAIRPFNRRGAWIKHLTAWLVRTADATVVTNEELSWDVLSLGGRPIVLPDPLPMLPRRRDQCDIQYRAVDNSVFVVATYAPDEPIDSILCAAAGLRDEATFVFSGNYLKLQRHLISQVPANVRFMGFLSEDEFVAQMSSAVCVLDLTLKTDCLVCGAYEALALGQPAVLSDSPAAHRLFGSVFELVDNTPRSIVQAIRRIFASRLDYQNRSREGAIAYRRTWNSYARAAEVRLFGSEA